jgi:hypothetical protein
METAVMITCISNIYQCGENGYDCQDPRGSLFGAASITATEEDINDVEEENAPDS